MTNRKEYASELTKEELVKMGVVAVDPIEARVFGTNGELRPVKTSAGYLMVNLYEVDNNGNRIKIAIKRQYKGCKKISNTWCYKMRLVGLHRLIWAWEYGKVEAGYVIDHINNKHLELEDYTISNLQKITQYENLHKDSKYDPRVLKPAKNRGVDYYQAKLEYYSKLYEQAKKDHNALMAHRYRSNMAHNRAKINYFRKLGQ